MPPLAVVSLKGLERSVIAETRPAKKPRIRPGSPKVIIEPADLDEASSSMRHGAPLTPRSSNKRPSRTSAARPNYDMKLHPMDDFMRPSFAARRRSIPTGSTQQSRTVSAADSATQSDETTSVEDDDQGGNDTVGDDDDDGDGGSDLDQHNHDVSREARTPDPKAARRSSRAEALKPVNYSQKVHPQDHLLPGRRYRNLVDRSSQPSSSNVEKRTVSGTSQKPEDRPYTAKLTHRRKSNPPSLRRLSLGELGAGKDPGFLGSPSSEPVPDNDAAIGSLDEGLPNSLFDPVTLSSTQTDMTLAEVGDDMVFVDTLLKISTATPSRTSCGLDLEAMEATVERMTQHTREQLFQILQRYQPANTVRAAEKRIDDVDTAAIFQKWRARRSLPALAPSPGWYRRSVGDGFEPPRSAQGPTERGSISSTTISSATISGASISSSTISNSAPYQPRFFDTVLNNTATPSANSMKRVKRYTQSFNELEIPESDPDVSGVSESDPENPSSLSKSSHIATDGSYYEQFFKQQDKVNEQETTEYDCDDDDDNDCRSLSTL